MFVTANLNRYPKALIDYFENVKHHLSASYIVEDKLFDDNGREVRGGLFCRVYCKRGKIENRWVEETTLTGKHVKAYLDVVNMDKVEIC